GSRTGRRSVWPRGQTPFCTIIHCSARIPPPRRPARHVAPEAHLQGAASEGPGHVHGKDGFVTRRTTNSEGLKTARLLMVLSSISPLFILWAIRGNSLIPDRWFISFCALMVILPNAFLWLRIWTAKKQADKRQISVGTADYRLSDTVYLKAES